MVYSAWSVVCVCIAHSWCTHLARASFITVKQPWVSIVPHSGIGHIGGKVTSCTLYLSPIQTNPSVHRSFSERDYARSFHSVQNACEHALHTHMLLVLYWAKGFGPLPASSHCTVSDRKLCVGQEARLPVQPLVLFCGGVYHTEGSYIQYSKRQNFQSLTSTISKRLPKHLLEHSSLRSHICCVYTTK